ncbi:MAG: aminotransferase class I/II-fold pyridoxal phosphate-dependent enzyme [Planctomycetes bacterium]|nr:aminotransferase class I/II-fold pyridoxal phosphate-dependent enzyme [Planctomycetota bacterium]
MTGKQFIAEHVKPIGSSGIRRVFDLGATLENPINLSIGQPDFPVPEQVKQAMIEAIRSDKNGYTVTRGIKPLRDRITTELQREFDWDPDVFVTSGTSGGLVLALMATLNPGEEVLIGDPYFVSYKHLVRLAGGVPVCVNLYDDFQLHPERYESAITKKTKMMIACSPGNPTGAVYRKDDVQALAEIARRHDLLIVSDEIYCDLSYDGPNASPVPFAPERTLLLRGFGKSHAMTGLRMGYAAGPTALISEMAKLQQYTFVCAPHPAQFGALAAMDTDMSERVDSYRNKRDLICAELEKTFTFVRPSGGFYVFPEAPAKYPSATAFVEDAIANNVLIIPGEVFSERDTHFRISYAAPDEKIREGCEILRSLAV